MLSLIRSIPDQLEYGWEESCQAIGKLPRTLPAGIIVCGMGGSGISGDLLRGLVFDTSSIPIETLKDYTLPSWINDRYLAVLSSYSGNTEEVLSILGSVKNTNKPLLAITSGGALEEIALSEGIPLVKLPSGNPPRASVGFMLAPLLRLASFLGLYTEAHKEFFTAVNLIRRNISCWEDEMKKKARPLKDTIPVIHSLDLRFQPLAYRLSCQLNENAKMLAHSNYYPEMNHNEIVAFEGNASGLSLILIDPGEGYTNKRNRQREEIVSQILPQSLSLARVTLNAEGENLLERFCSLLVKIDLLSFFLAEEKGVDPFSIASIDKLKEQMK